MVAVLLTELDEDWQILWSAVDTDIDWIETDSHCPGGACYADPFSFRPTVDVI